MYIKIWILCLSVLLCVNATALRGANDCEDPLSFRRAGDWLKFKVLVFSDLHYGENKTKDSMSRGFQERLLMLEAPVDLVIFNGDMSSNYAAPWYCRTPPDEKLQNNKKHDAGKRKSRINDPITRARCKEWWLKRWEEYTGPVKAHKIPYALNLGNHDVLEVIDSSGREQMLLDMHTPCSRSAVGPQTISRTSNYFLPIYDPGPVSLRDTPRAGVWILDSGSNSCLGAHGWGCVLPDQVAWFRGEAAVIGGVFSHMFVHIPVQEAISLWNRAMIAPAGNDQWHVHGYKTENVSCQALNTGLFGAISDTTLGVQGVWSGHDHNNDFYGQWTSSGPALGYSRKSGYGGYGGAVADSPGARVIEYSAPVSNSSALEWNTWVRLENGEMVETEGNIFGDRRTKELPGPLQLLCGGWREGE